MDCKDFIAMISEYETGELSADLRREAQQHLAQCPGCGTELRRFWETMALCRDSMDASLSAKEALSMVSSVSRVLLESHEPVFGPILTISDLSRYLRTSVDVIEDYLHEIPCFELGGQLLFRKEKVDEWIAKREDSFAFHLLRSQVERESHDTASDRAEQKPRTLYA